MTVSYSFLSPLDSVSGRERRSPYFPLLSLLQKIRNGNFEGLYKGKFGTDVR